MNLVSLALRRPISLLTVVIAVALVGFLAVGRMSRDIFPDLGVPVLYVAQPYGGMDPAQMEGFIVNYYEYHFLYITGIEHVESKSIQGVGLINRDERARRSQSIIRTARSASRKISGRRGEAISLQAISHVILIGMVPRKSRLPISTPQ
jgi:multidrug efflux pump subunit AcrB